MSPIAKKRRRILILVFVLLALVGGPVAWRYRPLSRTERTLVGEWQLASAPSDTHTIVTSEVTLTITLAADRRYSMLSGPPWPTYIITLSESAGSWQATDSRLTLTTDPQPPLRWNTVLAHVRSLLTQGPGTTHQVVELLSSDRIRLTDSAGNVITFKRVPSTGNEP